ncbi:MAG: hypothetical protein EOS65_10915 [Mesorhizobium sp.]|uniref:hypothetical protein n=1 Tax=Mesorhizobium sp. TaxID=1871066 RepID=UPI000FE77191|nr:hypothetical protein [Mesorhizobium sp.]RWF41846.1 MAG: hypothetical protein EOS65_10915 [Mesorhizobium sp.]
MPAPAFSQIDVVLAEDQKTVLLYAYEADDTTWLQSFALPMSIDESNVNHDEWRAAANPDGWRCMG